MPFRVEKAAAERNPITADVNRNAPTDLSPVRSTLTLELPRRFGSFHMAPSPTPTIRGTR
jgi:hypothetical protein